MSAKAVVVRDDPVSGTDTHDVNVNTGSGTAPGTANYQWNGKVRAETAAFFTIGGTPVSTVADQADLDPQHVAATPSGPPGVSVASFITPPSNDAAPKPAAGSRFFKAAGEYVLLNGDPFSGCQNGSPPGDLTVTASQSFFTVRE